MLLAGEKLIRQVKLHSHQPVICHSLCVTCHCNIIHVWLIRIKTATSLLWKSAHFLKSNSGNLWVVLIKKRKKKKSILTGIAMYIPEWRQWHHYWLCEAWHFVSEAVLLTCVRLKLIWKVLGCMVWMDNFWRWYLCIPNHVAVFVKGCLFENFFVFGEYF